MSVRGRRAWVGIVIGTLVALATGCDGSDGTTPVHAVGVVSVPRDPFIVQPLPKGWSVQEIQRPGLLPNSMQTLYLPSGSSVDHGPALAVGSYGQEEGYTLCTNPRRSPVKLNGPDPSPTLVESFGSLRTIEGEIATDHPGYVLARDLSEEQLTVAAHAARFTERNASIPRAGLPSGFRRVASAPVIPNSTFGDRISITDYSGRQFVAIGIYDGDAAADLLTQFWNATVAKAPCGHGNAKATRTITGSDVYARSNTSRQLLERVVRSITVTDRAGLEAFRAKGRELPASAILGACIQEPSRAVIIDGTVGRVRWIVGMSTTKQPSIGCTAFVVDGHREGQSAGGNGPAVAGPGSHDIDVLAGGSAGLTTGTVNLVAGTVPLATARATISDATGVTTEAKLVTVRSDPSRRYFAGLLTPSSISNAALSTTVVAYDDSGREIGRYNPPVTTG